MSGWDALVLAGSRGGDDPLATYAGVRQKALIQVGGRTMLARVVDAVRAAGAGRVAVVANDPEVCAAAEALGATVLPAAAGPSQSVKQALEIMGTPLLVTTADHALLEPEWIRRFLADTPAGADVTVLAAERAVVEAALPGVRRTYLAFADGRWSGCNLFYLATPRAGAVIDLWRRVEAERKRPWRIAALLGAGTLLSYATGRLTLAGAAARLGRMAGITAAAVASPFGLAAVDVDKPSDLDLVRGIVG